MSWQFCYLINIQNYSRMFLKSSGVLKILLFCSVRIIVGLNFCHSLWFGFEE